MNRFFPSKPLCAAIAAAATISTAEAGDILGRVADSGGGVGLAGVEVTLDGSNRRAATDRNGYFRINGLAAGEYGIKLVYPGAYTYEGTVTVGAEGSYKFEARMRPVGSFDEETLVIGQRAAQGSALSQQRASDTISSFLTRDSIGQFPDQNVTESLRRLPGVSVQNDQGEGRFIVLRGLDPSLNAASVNGVRITAPENDSRAIALDVVASELVDSVEFQKSLIPEMDGDAIGGAINIRTTSALDREGDFFSVTATGSYNDLEEEWSPKLGLDGSTVINERLGISVGLSYFERKLGSDNVEAEDWTDEDRIVYAESVEMRDYVIERTRIGGTLGLDYILNDSTTLFARGVYSSFEDFEIRSRVSMDFGDAAPVSGNDGAALFSLSGDEELEIVRDVKDRTETQVIASAVFGGETITGPWTFNYEASYSFAEEDENDSLDTTDFATTYEAGELVVGQSATSGDLVRIDVDPDSLANYEDTSRYEFDGIEDVRGLAEDDEYSLRFDVAREFETGAGLLEVKGGVKGRFREKTYDLTSSIYDDFAGEGDFVLAGIATTVDYPLNPIGPVPDPNGVRNFVGDLSQFELNQADTVFDNAASSYGVQEDILAGYLQARYEEGPLRVIGGLRVEDTQNDISGNLVTFVEEGGSFEGQPVDEDTTFVAPVEFEKSDTQVLPSLNLRYEASDKLIVRGAVYASLFRPNMSDLAPRFAVEENDAGEREGEFGNPDLDPYTAWNFDYGMEYYFADNAVVSFGVFYKEIEDFIFRQVIENTEINGVFVNEGSVPLNGESATVGGFEFNYQHALLGLPEPFNGIILGANYTYVDTEADLGTRTTELPATSETTANLVLGYELGNINMRLAYVYRDEYIDELSADGDADRWIKEHDQLDFSFKYQVTDTAQVFLEAINILDEPFRAVARTSAYGDRMLQYEEYSFTVNVGVRATF